MITSGPGDNLSSYKLFSFFQAHENLLVDFLPLQYSFSLAQGKDKLKPRNELTRDSDLLDSSLPTAVRQGFCVGAGGAACGGTARTHAKPG